MTKQKNTCWEEFSVDGDRHRRRYFERLFWDVRVTTDAGHENIWRNITDPDRTNELEQMYQEFIHNEQREQKLKRILR